jgi:Fe-S-cluster containining protein
MISSPRFFSCERCPAYCCSYARIRVTEADLSRLARHLGINAEAARAKLTKWDAEGKTRIMRHRRDRHFGTVCRFLDRETRVCKVYKARPKICRDFPGTRRCGYYDFLAFERRLLRDPDHIATTGND